MRHSSPQGRIVTIKNQHQGYALVTGASSGIGEALARRLAAAGWRLLLTARSEAKLAALARELAPSDGACRTITADLSNPQGVAAALAGLEREGLEVDLLVNNAGVGVAGEFAALDAARQRQMLELNIQSLVALTHACLQPMRRRGRGMIVNIASVAGLQPVPYMAAYAASKAFVLSFSLALWAENRRRGVHVMAVCPGTTETAFFAAAGMRRGGPGAQTPDAVARETLAAMAARRRLVITGGRNRAMAALVHWLPPAWVLAAAARFASSRLAAGAVAQDRGA